MSIVKNIKYRHCQRV